MQEARFDRHFVRDLTWSRHQLEELAERRFLAAQKTARANIAMADHPEQTEAIVLAFQDLFKKVCVGFLG